MNQPPVLLIETRYLDLQFLNTVLEGNRVDTALLGIGIGYLVDSVEEAGGIDSRQHLYGHGRDLRIFWIF
ncbi:hypothetical protein PPTG_22141 [Phytophthora nicotianae INRA-310]|uniref:Uncharacterized protein n=1 Tax=Phytophthora nicotianae (strain INRA-310) TaxID=761204 RepID=W2QNI6_PHYN3|nr:hypothetical protein PPTG_22141 [Phytophthora nicotianae INRA-310]ETN14531.1 hypothetical protein PPTG_22141 [Phytophthora nicotianae INRA-310]